MKTKLRISQSWLVSKCFTLLFLRGETFIFKWYNFHHHHFIPSYLLNCQYLLVNVMFLILCIILLLFTYAVTSTLLTVHNTVGGITYFSFKYIMFLFVSLYFQPILFVLLIIN